MATLSILALYDYDASVLEGLTRNLPQPGKVPIDMYPDTYVEPVGLDVNALIDNIMIECAELEFMYPSISLAKRAINAWAVGMSHKWQKLYNTMWLIYNPLWNNWRRLTGQRDTNTSGNNTETRDLAGSRDINRKVNTTRTDDLTETTGYTSTTTRTDNLSQTVNTETSVSAYNSESYEPKEKTTSTTTNSGTVTTDDEGEGCVLNTGTLKNEGSDNSSETSSDSGTVKYDTSNTGRDNYNEQTEGSIGVITSEIMLQQEREAALFNMYDIITTDFKNRFCLLIY